MNSSFSHIETSISTLDSVQTVPPGQQQQQQQEPDKDHPRQHPPPQPRNQGQKCHTIFITVFEHSGPIIPGLTRKFMRHSGIAVQTHETQPLPPTNPSSSSSLSSSSLFSIFHITGTPGIGMTFHHLPHHPDPRSSEPTLLAMFPVGNIASSDLPVLEQILSEVEIKVDWGWNCQDWVRGAVGRMVERGFLGEEEGREAVGRQRQVIESGL